MEWHKFMGMNIFSALVPLVIMAMTVDWVGGVPAPGTKQEGEVCGSCFSPDTNFDCGKCIDGLECVKDPRSELLPDLPSRCTRQNLATSKDSTNNNMELIPDLNSASYGNPDFPSEGDIDAMNRRYPIPSFYDYSSYDNPVPFGSPNINSNDKEYGPYYSPVDYFLPEQSRSKDLKDAKGSLVNYLKPNTNIHYSDYTSLPEYNTDTLYDYNVNPE
jgi:hypothetical protein